MESSLSTEKTDEVARENKPLAGPDQGIDKGNASPPDNFPRVHYVNNHDPRPVKPIRARKVRSICLTCDQQSRPFTGRDCRIKKGPQFIQGESDL
jgi:hypothetical protein